MVDTDNNNFSEDNFSDFDDILIETDFDGEIQDLEEETKNKKPVKNKSLTLLILSLSGVLLFSIILTGILFALSDAENSVLSLIGITSLNALSFIKLSLTLVFSLSSLVGLLFFLVNLFQYSQIDYTLVEERQKKFKNVLMGGITFGASVILAFLISIFWIVTPKQVEKIDYITANLESTLNLTAPIEIQFSALNLPIDTTKAQIVSYNWDFGDGESGTGQTIVHTFKNKPANGVYEVKLGVSYFEVADASQTIQRLEFSRLIGIQNVETTAFINASTVEGFAPLEVEFDATSSVDVDGSIIAYEWDFDGDSVIDAEGETAVHSFEEEGVFNTKLIVTDNNGQSSEASIEINVKSDEVFSPRIKNTPSDDVLTPDRSYQFDASDSSSLEGEITEYKWNFGDGKTRVGRKVSYSFETEGIYEVTLELLDEAGNKTQYFQDYTVSNSPSGLFPKVNAIPKLENDKLVGSIPFKIQLDAGVSSGAQIVEYDWDFENDSIIDASGQLIEHVYTQPGNYELKLTITSITGKTATKIIPVEVFDSELQPIVSATPKIGNIPLEVTFDATATKSPKNSNIVQYRWNFNDGTPILRGGPIVTHLFTRTGEFDVEVTAVTDENKLASTNVLIFVNEIPLKACYKPSRLSGDAPLTVSFNPNCTTGNAATFEWQFDELGDSEDRKPSFTFEEPGEYQVTLKVFDPNKNLSEFTETIIVN